jgi:hypothetical protein
MSLYIMGEVGRGGSEGLLEYFYFYIFESFEPKSEDTYSWLKYMINLHLSRIQVMFLKLKWKVG